MNRLVQVEVMQLVCCPAKSSAMINPVTCSSVMGDPSLYLVSIKMLKMSVPCPIRMLHVGIVASVLDNLTEEFDHTILLRAALRFLCLRWGVGGKTVRGVSPRPRLWYSSDTSLNRFSRTSSPWRHRLEVNMVSSDKAWNRSRVPLSPQDCKYCRASLSILAVYPLRRAVRIPLWVSEGRSSLYRQECWRYRMPILNWMELKEDKGGSGHRSRRAGHKLS